jgi:recombination protein RecA
VANKSVASVLGKLKGAFKEAVTDVKVVGTIPRVFLESPSLNFIFGGGFGKGRIYEFFGPESSGKSTLATYIGGEIQKKNDRPIVVYMDFEYSFDEAFANKLGLSTDQDDFILLRPENGETGFQLLKEIMEQLPVGLVIIDSIAATPSIDQMNDAFKANFGSAAKVFSNGLKFINPYLAKYETSLILINQERANVGAMWGPTTTTPGGYAVKYYSSWRGRITRIDYIKNKGLITGIVCAVKNKKNKIGVPFRESELKLSFENGFNSEDEYMQFVVDLGIVKQGGAWFSNEEWGMKVQGREGVLTFLKEQPLLFEQVKRQINEMLCKETVLDEEHEEVHEEEDDIRPPEEMD